MDNVDKYLKMGFSNSYTKSILTLFLVLYGGLAAPKLPAGLLKLFDNQIFRIIILALIVYMGQKDAMFAIMIAVAFVISMNTLSQKKIQENFSLWTDLKDDYEKVKCDVESISSSILKDVHKIEKSKVVNTVEKDINTKVIVKDVEKATGTTKLASYVGEAITVAKAVKELMKCYRTCGEVFEVDGTFPYLDYACYECIVKNGLSDYASYLAAKQNGGSFPPENLDLGK